MSLLLIGDPLFAIENVLVPELAALRQLERHKPLIGDVIKLHRVLAMPVIPGAHHADTLVTWTSIVQLESEGLA